MIPPLKNHRFRFVVRILCLAMVGLLGCVSAPVAHAEDGYRLWLRYDPLPAGQVEAYRSHVTSVVAPANSSTQVATRNELVTACSGLLGQSVPATTQLDGSGAVIVGTPQSSTIIADLNLDQELAALGPEGYLIRSVTISSQPAIVIASASDVGALYGAFHFLRLIQTLQPIDALNVSESPRFKLRVLDHWDNLDGSIERGYAGNSLWNWSALPGTVDPRLTDYARADASLGINGAVLNNVNASSTSLTTAYLQKTAAIADAFRPYGVRVYLVSKFSAPIDIGGLSTADPLDPGVIAWWKAKADEIYNLIPDFGGFLVKADSEGQSGPAGYGRTQAQGANVLAAALAPHNGVVMWRAFVYTYVSGADRIAQSYQTMKPLDGQFASNVILQVKNGPLDFQPREPFHPLFGGMPQTPVMPEFQITQEYLGHENHVAFLATMWKEVLDSDTYAQGAGSTVAKVVDGSLFGQTLTGIAGVANTGNNTNWTGHHMAQANWFAFGRLAWNPDLSASAIAQEWAAMTLTTDATTAAEISRILLESREAVVDYMTPLGLAHQMWHDNHYGPEPWDKSQWREDWQPPYYNRAATDGIGFDRISNSASGDVGAVNQYYPTVRDLFTNLATCPDKSLLWFHHVPWDYKMSSGRTLWDELCLHYQRGVDWTVQTRQDWAALAGKIDSERYAAVAEKLAIQEHDARWWRDACLLYFQTFSNRPFPDGVEPMTRTLAQIQAWDSTGNSSGNTNEGIYAFEGNSRDSSGNQNNGAPTAMSFTTGKIGAQAAQFNGTSSNVSLPKSPTDDFTVAMWVKTTDTAGSAGNNWWAGKALVDGEVSGGAADWGTAIVNGKFVLGVGSTSGDTTIASSVNINDGTWHHVLATRKSSDGSVTVYVDGVSRGTGTGPTGSRTATTSLRIGASRPGGSAFLNGTLDDVRVYGRILTATEITALASGAKPATPPTGVAALPGDGSITLNWTASSTASGYYVKRATTSGGPYTTLGIVASPHFLDTGVTNGTTYYYVVSAMNTYGESANSSSQASAAPSEVKVRYAFEGNAQDSGGGGFDGTATALTYVTGRIGAQAAQFNGTSSSVSIPKSITDDFTIAMWVKTTDTGGSAGGQWWSGKGLVDGEIGGGGADFGTSIVNGKFVLGIGATSGDTTVASSVNVNDGAWHHIAATRDNTSGAMAVYVDGVLRGSGTGPTGSRSWPTSLRIGSLLNGSNFLNGALDDVRLYSRILSASEIQTLAAGQLATPQNVTATPGNAKVTLSWNAVSGADDYTIQRAASSGGPFTDLATGVTPTTYQDAGLADGTTWYYTIAANGLPGLGTASAPVSATTYTTVENWRFANFGTIANSGNAADSADPDGDGLTNTQEFTSGTNPNSAASALKIAQVQTSGSNLVVSFPTVSGKTYRVERSDTLQSGSWSTVQDNIAGTDAILQITDPGAAAQSKRFYRVVVW
jgi:alpha-glucuronidase